MRKLKPILLILALFMVLCSGGCRVIEQFSITDHINQDLHSILDCLSEKDSDTLKSLFCDAALNKIDDFDEQLDAFLNSFDGKIIEYSSVNFGDGCSVRDGKYVDYHVNPYVNDVVTDTGKTYYVVYYDKIIDANDLDKEGVWYIVLIDELDNRYRIGERDL